jgi:ABC-type transporter Mla MlaB component
MGTQVEQQVDRTALRIRGPVRLGEVPELLEHARVASGRGLPVELDLGEAEHLHTAAWQVLAALDRELRKQGRELRVSRASEATNAMLELLEKTTWLPRREDDD